MTGAIERTSVDVEPFNAVVGTLEATGEHFEPNRADARARHYLLMGYPDIQEREMMKTQTLESAMADVLASHGVRLTEACMAADADTVIWKVNVEQYNRVEQQCGFLRHLHDVLAEFVAVVHAASRRVTVAAASPASRPLRDRSNPAQPAGHQFHPKPLQPSPAPCKASPLVRRDVSYAPRLDEDIDTKENKPDDATD